MSAPFFHYTQDKLIACSRLSRTNWVIDNTNAPKALIKEVIMDYMRIMVGSLNQAGTRPPLQLFGACC